MQFKFNFKLSKPLRLPIAYHSQLQGLIYNVLSDNPEYSEFLHDIGYGDKPQSFKLFVFSLLSGPSRIEPPYITFYDYMSFELRSPVSDFCNIILMSVNYRDSFYLMHQQLKLDSCTISHNRIEAENISIRMLSPLCLHSTYYEEKKRKTRYFTPLDPDFNKLLNLNLSHKYSAAFGKEPSKEIRLTCRSLSEDDKYVTKFNDKIYITAWNGQYDLSGRPDILSFLYDTGLGDRNSQGFGMFTVHASSPL